MVGSLAMDWRKNSLDRLGRKEGSVKAAVRETPPGAAGVNDPGPGTCDNRTFSRGVVTTHSLQPATPGNRKRSPTETELHCPVGISVLVSGGP